MPEDAPREDGNPSRPLARIVIFAKAPTPGLVKTRLIPALGEAGATRLARRMLARTVETALAAGLGPVELCAAPEPKSPAWAGHGMGGIVWSDQGSGDLGDRLARATERVVAAGESAILIGTDCPELGVTHLQQAAAELTKFDAVMIPAMDGGYVLLALRVFAASLFSKMPWSGPTVASETIRRGLDLGLSVQTHPALRDIDEPGDLRWLPPTWREEI